MVWLFRGVGLGFFFFLFLYENQFDRDTVAALDQGK